jgi:hypothetical protein
MASLLYLLNPNPAITTDAIKTPNTIRYSYGLWVYVNSWPTNGATLFSVSDGAAAGATTLLDLKLATSTLKLTTDIRSADNTSHPIDITNNFPAQKWTHVIISVDASVVDVYLDGKLVISTVIKDTNGNPTNSRVSSQPQINFGSGYDIYLSKFQRWTFVTDPQSAWYNYYAGNGLVGSGDVYGAKLSILQNNISQQDFKLF